MTALVVGGLDYGDADRIVRLLTPELGRVAALARRARARSPRFGGALDTGNRVEVRLRQGRGDLHHLQEAKLLDGREGARAELVRLSLLAYACELCGALAREAHPEPRLYGLLDMTATLLDAMTAPPGEAFRAGLEAKALTFAGLAPALARCVACGGPLEGAMALHPVAGGAVHRRCEPGGLPVTPAWLEAVEAARRAPLRDLVDTPLPPGPPWALARTVEAHLGRALKSRKVLAGLLGLPGADTVGP